MQATLDLGDDQRAGLMAAQRRYRGALRALAKERATINAAMAAAAAPGKDGLKKVLALLTGRSHPWRSAAVSGWHRSKRLASGACCRDQEAVCLPWHGYLSFFAAYLLI